MYNLIILLLELFSALMIIKDFVIIKCVKTFVHQMDFVLVANAIVIQNQLVKIALYLVINIYKMEFVLISAQVEILQVQITYLLFFNFSF